MNKNLILLFLFILLAQTGYAASTSVVVLNPQQTSYNLRPHLEIYSDPTNRLTIQQVSSTDFSKNFVPFTALKKKQYDATGWMRFRIENPTDQLIHLFLTKGEPGRSSANGWFLYVKNQQGQLTELPRNIGFSFQAILFFYRKHP